MGRDPLITYYLVMLSTVFVYGTLKPGLQYHGVAQAGGTFVAQEAYIEGYDIYHLSPENYPAVIEGTRRVYGWCYTYENIECAMPHLDELEGVDESPPLYNRKKALAYLNAPDGEHPVPIETWLYMYENKSRICAGPPSALLIQDGDWLPR